MFPKIIENRDLRSAIDDAVDQFVIGWADVLEAFFSPLLHMLNFLERSLIGLPWWLVIAAFALLTFVGSRRWGLTIFVTLLMFLLGVLDLWEDSMRTMALMLVCTFTAVVIGIPVGILMSRSDRLQAAVLLILDVMQTMPSFVYLIPAIMLFGPGKIPAVLATVIYAVPPLIRLTDLGIRMVDEAVLEATTAFGANNWQKLFGVQMPLALPNIMAGINQTTMMALAMVVIASMIGAKGLGYQVLQGITRLEVGRGLLAGLAIVILAIVFDRITQSFGKRAQSYLHIQG